MFLNWEYISRTYDELDGLVRPATADEPESFNAVLYDTQTYAVGGTARLEFFSSTAASLADRTMSNFAAGTLEPGAFFEIHRIFLYILAVPSLTTTAAVTGTANDLEILHKTARGNFTLEMTGKRLLPCPINFAGQSGGGEPVIAVTYTAPAIAQFPNTSKNGGFPVLGSIVIPPVTKITGFLDFNATAISAAVNIRMELAGVYHRRVA